MTTDLKAPDAALLWAREKIAYSYVGSDGREDAIMAGNARGAECDELAEAFRAGQSHERRADAGLLAALIELASAADDAAEYCNTGLMDSAIDKARAAINAAKGHDNAEG